MVGADFVCIIIGMPIGQEPNWNIDDKQWKKAAKTWIENTRIEEESVNNIIGRLKEDVEEVKFVWNGGYRRDAVVFERGHEKLLVTGGLSRGDDPTEMYTIVDDLYSSGLVDVLGFNRHLDDNYMKKLDPLLRKLEARGLKREADKIRTIFHQFAASMIFR